MSLLSKCIFITATDTDAGKTYSTVNLLKFLNSVGFRTIAIKPLASGAEDLQPLKNEDIKALCDQQKKQPELVNSLLFEKASAPNILADLQGRPLNISTFNEIVLELLEKK